MYNVIKFQAPFERLKQYDLSPEVRLCKAIIIQSLIDATNTSNLPKSKKIELEAKKWIFGGSQHFKDICHGAEIEPHLVIKITQEAIKLNRQKLLNNDILVRRKNTQSQVPSKIIIKQIAK